MHVYVHICNMSIGAAEGTEERTNACLQSVPLHFLSFVIRSTSRFPLAVVVVVVYFWWLGGGMGGRGFSVDNDSTGSLLL